MPIDWNTLAANAGTATDAEVKNQISSLSRLNDADIEKLINDTGISKEDLAEVLKIVNNATESNEAKAQSIANINKGFSVLVSVASKLL